MKQQNMLRGASLQCIHFVAALVVTFWVAPAFAAGPLRDGVAVRVTSHSVEAGWFDGKARIDERGCWMIHLDKPTRDHYTMLALMVVDQLQISANGIWTAIQRQPLIKAQPAQCLEEGSD